MELYGYKTHEDRYFEGSNDTAVIERSKKISARENYKYLGQLMSHKYQELYRLTDSQAVANEIDKIMQERKKSRKNMSREERISKDPLDIYTIEDGIYADMSTTDARKQSEHFLKMLEVCSLGLEEDASTEQIVDAMLLREYAKLYEVPFPTTWELIQAEATKRGDSLIIHNFNPSEVKSRLNRDSSKEDAIIQRRQKVAEFKKRLAGYGMTFSELQTRASSMPEGSSEKANIQSMVAEFGGDILNGAKLYTIKDVLQRLPENPTREAVAREYLRLVHAWNLGLTEDADWDLIEKRLLISYYAKRYGADMNWMSIQIEADKRGEEIPWQVIGRW